MICIILRVLIANGKNNCPAHSSDKFVRQCEIFARLLLRDNF